MNNIDKRANLACQHRLCRFKMMVICLLCTSLLFSCAAPAIQTVEVTRIIQQTVVVTRLIELVITATYGPPGSAQSSTLTPSPFVVWDAQQVLDAYLAAGLEVSNPRPMIADDYGLVPMLSLDGVRFYIPSICSDCGGRIMSFADAEKLQIVRDYYGQMGRFSAVLFSWVFVKDNILVQLNGQLPEANAGEYEAALRNMK
jgi:hypothetical protein